MKTILIGTSNSGKIKEVERFLGDLAVEWKTLAQVAPGFDIAETEETFEGNAKKKALEIAKQTGLPTIASDGGMVVPALGGWPGVRSHRLTDEREKSDEEIIQIFKDKIAGLSADQRRYKFISVFAFALPSGEVTLGRGEHVGELAETMHSQSLANLPYRRFWWIPQFNKYFLNLTEAEKDSINHNGQALRLLRPTIEKYLAS